LGSLRLETVRGVVIEDGGRRNICTIWHEGNVDRKLMYRVNLA